MPRRVIFAGTAVVLLVTGMFLVRPDSVADVDNKVCDLLTGMVGRGQLSGRVTIVEIDEDSLARFGRWPWPRDLLGLTVRRILERGAATVALDLMLHEEDIGRPNAQLVSAETDCARGTSVQALACEISGKPVVVGYAFQFEKSRSTQ